MPTTPVERLKNLGPASARWLVAAELHTRADLERAGSVLAYKIVRHRLPEAPINVLLLYALEGALRDVPWQALTPNERAALRHEAETPLDVSFE